MASEAQDFGDVGQARQNFQRMSAGMNRLKDIMEQAEDDDLVNLETWVKELAKTVHSMFLSTGSMFVQESLRGDLKEQDERIRRRRRKTVDSKRNHGAQGDDQPQGSERRQRVVQAMAPEVHHSTWTVQPQVRGDRALHDSRD